MISALDIAVEALNELGEKIEEARNALTEALSS